MFQYKELMVRADSRHMDFMRKNWSYYKANRDLRPNTHVWSSRGFNAGSIDSSIIHPSNNQHGDNEYSKGNREYKTGYVVDT